VTDAGDQLATFRREAIGVRLYKYWPLEHVQNLVTHGKVRVGTLDEFRKMEAGFRRDEGEASGTFREQSGHRASFRDLTPMGRSVADRAMGPASRSIVFDRCTFQASQVHPNAYAFCTSRELSRAAAAGAVACFEIVDPVGFFERLSDGVHKELTRLAYRSGLMGAGVEATCRPVMYGSRERSAAEYGKVDVAFLKPPEFEFENEFRFLWRSPVLPAGPWHEWTDPALTDLVRIVPIP
jgi:hypothetical protein